MRTQAIVFSVVLGACLDTPSYYYAPEQAEVLRSGMPTRIERIPPEAPQGTVEISTRGITRGQRGDRALHVRMTVFNEGDDVPWTIDIRELLVEVPGVGRSRPFSASAGVKSMPSLSVPRRDRRILDLYYPVPPRVRDEDNLLGFEFLWQVNTAGRPVSGRAVIDRIEIIDEPTYGYIAAGWSPYWWYDPGYPRVAYQNGYVRPHDVHSDYRQARHTR